MQAHIGLLCSINSAAKSELAPSYKICEKRQILAGKWVFLGLHTCTPALGGHLHKIGCAWGCIPKKGGENKFWALGEFFRPKKTHPEASFLWVFSYRKLTENIWGWVVFKKPEICGFNPHPLRRKTRHNPSFLDGLRQSYSKRHFPSLNDFKIF